jgi:hypothetical protein
MLTLALLALVAGEPAAAPVPFDAITVERAVQVGASVVISFTVGTPPYTAEVGGRTVTVCGPLDADDVERVVMLRGDRLKDVDRGKRLRVEGALRVIRHPAEVVAGVEVPAWVEIRVEE